MKVAYDTRPMKIKGNGISNYTSIIYDRMQNEKDISLLSVENPIHDNSRGLFNKLKFYIGNHIILPIKFKQKKVKIYHTTRELEVPIIKTCKYISTIHDIIPYVYPSQYIPNKLKLLVYKMKIMIAIRNSDIIITDSLYSKNDIIKNFKCDPEKIKVVYLSVDSKYKRASAQDISDVRNRLNIKNNYILGIGGGEYRKNIVTLINAFKKIKEQTNTDLNLVIVGKNNGNLNNRNNSNDGIIYTGYVDDNELISLYGGADVFVYPSLYEGFGLPPLEAMACGTPVITSNTSSIPEVLGDSALFFNPLDADELCNTIVNLLNNQELRDELVKKGHTRLQQYSWDNTISEIKQIYNCLGN